MHVQYTSTIMKVQTKTPYNVAEMLHQCDEQLGTMPKHGRRRKQKKANEKEILLHLFDD